MVKGLKETFWRKYTGKTTEMCVCVFAGQYIYWKCGQDKGCFEEFTVWMHKPFTLLIGSCYISFVFPTLKRCLKWRKSFNDLKVKGVVMVADKFNDQTSRFLLERSKKIQKTRKTIFQVYWNSMANTWNNICFSWLYLIHFLFGSRAFQQPFVYSYVQIYNIS